MRTRPLAILVGCYLALGPALSRADAPAVGPAVPALPKPPPGFRIEVVAQAPAIRHPSIVMVSPDGRVFVGEDPMDISRPAHVAEGRILVFHPDGRVTVFADKLHAVFGLLYLDGKVYVHHGPRLSLYQDGGDVGRDPIDLIPTTNPKPWALDWNDHVPANLRLGMDGYLYMSVGDKGIYGAVGRDGKAVELHGGGVLRLRPDGTALEVYATGTRNHLDVALNEEDEIFTYDNSDERNDWWTRVTHMVDGGYYGYPWDYKPRRPYTLWMMADYGGGAPTAGFAYNEDGLPDEYRGNLFFADFGKRAILRLRIARAGATYKVLSRQDFGTEPPSDYRPVGLALAPDGTTFYVGDWQHRDVKAKAVVGRLLKLSYTGPSRAAPRPAWYVPAALGRPIDASTDELIAALSHPSQAVRLVAQRRVAERGPVAAAPLIGRLMDTKAPRHARWHAIWALDALDGGVAGRAAILAAVRDRDPTVRMQAIRQLGTRAAAGAVPSLIPALADSNPAVRFRSATALGRIGARAGIPALHEALRDRDLFARFAAFTALRRIGERDAGAWPAIARGLRHVDPAIRTGTLFALRETHAVEVVETLADPTLSPPVRAEALSLLARLARKPPPWKGEWWAYFPLSGTPPRRTETWEGTARALDAVRGALPAPAAAVRRAAVQALGDLQDEASAPALVALFRRERDNETRNGILAALAAMKKSEAGALAGEVLTGPRRQLHRHAVLTAEAVGAVSPLVNYLQRPDGEPEALRLALRALGAMKAAEAAPAVDPWLAAPSSSGRTRPTRTVDGIRAAAATARGQIGGPGAPESLRPLLRDPSLEVRRAAIGAFGALKDREAVPALLAAFEDVQSRAEAVIALAQVPDVRAVEAYLFGIGSPAPPVRASARRALTAIAAEALPIILERLRTSPPPPAAIAQLHEIYRPLSATLPTGPLFESLAGQLEPDAYVAYAAGSAPGDAARGRKIFQDPSGVGCTRCHRVGGEGGTIGPELSTIGVQFSKRELAESIVYPSRAMREGYEQFIVKLRGGEELAGFARAETGDELVLEDAEGSRRRVRKSDIARREPSRVSIMPEGLHAALSLQEFADLVAYLASLR